MNPSTYIFAYGEKEEKKTHTQPHIPQLSTKSVHLNV